MQCVKVCEIDYCVLNAVNAVLSCAVLCDNSSVMQWFFLQVGIMDANGDLKAYKDASTSKTRELSSPVIHTSKFSLSSLEFRRSFKMHC
jgi:hypothetical protein